MHMHKSVLCVSPPLPFHLVVSHIIDLFNTARPTRLDMSRLPPVPLPPFHPITHSLGSHCSTNVWTLFYICISSRTQSKQPLAWHIQVDYHNPLFVDDAVGVQMMDNVRCDTTR